MAENPILKSDGQGWTDQAKLAGDTRNQEERHAGRDFEGRIADDLGREAGP